MENVKKFLLAPDESKDDFWESDFLIWVDWRDFDDSIIKYFNDKLPDEDKIQFECVEIEKEREIDIFLCKNGVKTAIPYAEDCTDRDTTLKSIQEYVSRSIKCVGIWIRSAVIRSLSALDLLHNGSS